MGHMNLAVLIRQDMICTHLPGHRLRSYGVLADDVILKPRKGLQRGAEREMGGERMVDVGHAAFYRMLGNALGWTDPSDAPAIDLDVADLAIVHSVPRHEHVMRSLPSGKANAPRARRELAVSLIGAAVERLLEPSCIHLLEQRQASLGCQNIFAPNLSGIDQQRAFLAESFSGRLQLVAVIFQTTAPERSPAAFHRPKTGLFCFPAQRARFLG